MDQRGDLRCDDEKGGCIATTDMVLSYPSLILFPSTVNFFFFFCRCFRATVVVASAVTTYTHLPLITCNSFAG